MISIEKSSLPEYRYGAARTMVFLRAQYLLECLAVWNQAKAAEIFLPETNDSAYVSLETLLSHVLRADRGYLVWICKMLELPDPQINPAPAHDVIADQAENYIAHLIERWSIPLANVNEERFYRGEYESNWGIRYCIDAMLEHAVMHPILHREQLEELLHEQSPAAD
jgi:uncharacterized damage-inducible protein DinB